MGRLAFSFQGRSSPVRDRDIRFRVAATVVLGIGILGAPASGLALLTLVVGALLAGARSRLSEVLGVLKGFSGFLIFYFALGWAWEPTAAQAAFLGLQALRLTLLLLLGQVLSVTATPSDVTDGIRWYLGWLGRRRAWAASSMAGWALASVPQVLDQASGLSDAAALRGVRPGRRPLGSLKLLTLGLLVRTVDRSLNQSDALVARGWGLEVPESPLRAGPRDGLFLAALALAALAAGNADLLLGAILGA